MMMGTVEVFESQTVDNSPYTSVAGKTTYRLWLELTPDQASVYAMYGSQQNLPYVPLISMSVARCRVRTARRALIFLTRTSARALRATKAATALTPRQHSVRYDTLALRLSPVKQWMRLAHTERLHACSTPLWCPYSTAL
jgi:hypothetical protein